MVFIGPCISKKDEVDKYPDYVDCALTFDELNDWMAESGVEFDFSQEDLTGGGRARWFPTRGGIIESMDIDDDFSYFSVDGIEDCMNALEISFGFFYQFIYMDPFWRSYFCRNYKFTTVE